VTDMQNQLLYIQVADCQAVIVVDPGRKVVANIHSGWRGSIQNIVGQTIERMKICGCRAEHLLCAIGPSLGPCCAEFKSYRSEIPRQYWSYGDERNYFDFWRLTRDQLTATGVRAAKYQYERYLHPLQYTSIFQLSRRSQYRPLCSRGGASERIGGYK
jgi:polyphenol oxidase